MWSIAYSFEDMERAGIAYTKVRDIVFGRHIDASVYRIQLDAVPLLILVGNGPVSDRLREGVELACASGEKASLPDEVRDYLLQRRQDNKLPGAFWEGNYRLGIVANRRKRGRRLT